MSITVEQLRTLLHYDPETGVFTRLVNRRGYMCKAGMAAGTIRKDGYRHIGVLGVNYLAHRLVWLYVHGEWPTLFIDHINGNRDDNRLANLRHVERAVNNENRKRADRDSVTGLLGVSLGRNGYVATIRVRGKRLHLGTFGSAEAAHVAYLRAKRAYHKGCTL